MLLDNSTEKNKKTITEYRISEKNLNDLVLSGYQVDKLRPETLYYNFVAAFAKTLGRIGKGYREDGSGGNGTRRKITHYSFRHYVKSKIADLGFSDYSEWYIGHSGSTYLRKKDNEKAQILKKSETYFTFLIITQLTRQGADLESKLKELQAINQELRQKI